MNLLYDIQHSNLKTTAASTLFERLLYEQIE